MTRPIPSLLRFGGVLDPRAEEVSVGCIDLAGADPSSPQVRSGIDAVLESFADILEVGWIPGRGFAFIDVGTRADVLGARALEIRLGVGICGPRGSTAAEADTFRDAAIRALTRAGSPYSVCSIDPALVLRAPGRHAVQIVQPVVAVSDEYDSAEAIVRFRSDADPWLGLVRCLLEASAPARLRASMLATTAGLAELAQLQRDLVVARNLVGATATTPELQARARQFEATLIAHLTSCRGNLWVGEVLVAGMEPLPEIVSREVGRSISAQAPAVRTAARRLDERGADALNRPFSGGFEIVHHPPFSEIAFEWGLPRPGTAVRHKLRDLFALPEALCAFRWPIPSGAPVPTIPLQLDSVLPAPAGLPTEGARIGTDPYGVPIRIPSEPGLGHVHLLGVTGSGKSSAMIRLVEDDLVSGRGFVLIDPHGDLAARAIALATGANRPFLLIDPTSDDTDRLHVVGDSSSGPEEQEQDIARVIDAVTSHLPEDWAGPRFRSTARCVLTVLANVADREPVELGQVSSVLSDPAFRKRLQRLYTGPTWAMDELRNLAEATDARDLASWAASKFADFTTRSALRRVLAPFGDGVSLLDALSDGVPVIANLSKGALSSLDSRFLGHLVLAQAIDAILARPPSGDGEPVSVYVDEVHSFPAVNIERGLAETRKFGGRLVLAHQNLRQLDPRTTDAVLGGCATRLWFRMAPDDAAFLGAQTGLPPSILSSQANLEAIVLMAARGQELPPFSLRVEWPGTAPIGAVQTPSRRGDDLAQIEDGDGAFARALLTCLHSGLSARLRQMTAHDEWSQP